MNVSNSGGESYIWKFMVMQITGLVDELWAMGALAPTLHAILVFLCTSFKNWHLSPPIKENPGGGGPVWPIGLTKITVITVLLSSII